MSIPVMRARIQAHQGEDARALVMELPETPTLCGWVSLVRAEVDRSLGILTYWLGENFQGRGIMRQAAPAAVAQLARLIPVARLRAAVQVENGASISILSGLGMTLAEVGQIWCPARDREEPCLWFEMPAAAALALGGDCAMQASDVDVAKLVDAADFNWSARGETRGAEPLKFGER